MYSPARAKRPRVASQLSIVVSSAFVNLGSEKSLHTGVVNSSNGNADAIGQIIKSPARLHSVGN